MLEGIVEAILASVLESLGDALLEAIPAWLAKLWHVLTSG